VRVAANPVGPRDTQPISDGVAHSLTPNNSVQDLTVSQCLVTPNGIACVSTQLPEYPLGVQVKDGAQREYFLRPIFTGIEILD
jgi:hypothetical protein